MTTISVPLPADLLRRLDDFIHQGKADSKASVLRTALEKYLEDQAVEEILRASKEPTLYGDLDELAKRIV